MSNIRSLDLERGIIHVTTNHTGKMMGIHSISTSVLANHNCEQRRKNNDSICSHCFAASMMKRYASMQKAFLRNSEVLSTRSLEDHEIPVFTSLYGRFESFGDLINELQAQNYIKIARLNPSVRFALWTKNIWILDHVFATESKPENLNVILSSPIVNKALDPEQVATAHPFVDAIFTVYSPSFIAENDVQINCGARSCFRCHRCYDSMKSHSIMMINEVLK